MGIADYLVGRRVYKGGTNAPTRGTVDPTGYIDRELNKVADSRSGLAAAALRRMGSLTAAPTQQAPQQIQSMTATSGPTGGVGTTAPGSVGSIPPKILRVNQVGRLQVPDLNAIANNFQAPFNPDDESALVDLQGQRNKFTSDLTQGRQGLERDYTLKHRGVEQEQPQNIRRLIDDYSGRGLVHSSGYTGDFGDMQNQYANMLSQLDQDRQFGIDDLTRQEGLFNNDYSTKLTGIQNAAARHAAEALAVKQQDEIDAAAAANTGVLADRAGTPVVGTSPYVLPPGYTDTTANGTGAPQITSPTGDSSYIGTGRPFQPGHAAGAMDPRLIPVSTPAGPPAAPMATPNVTPLPSPVAPAAPAAAMNPSTLRWEGPIDDASRRALAAGQEVRRGNGYVYKMSGPNGTGVPIRIR